MTEPERRAALDALYATLPTMACVGKCKNYCGAILMSPAEERRIFEASRGRGPGWDEHLSCSLLCPATGQCTVYAIRPAICRLFGMVPMMACEHGCKPSRWMTDREGREFLVKVEEIGA